LRRALAQNDSYRFFAALGDGFRPGATGTNVMDIKIAMNADGEPPVR
jgi:glycerate-2-kinase